MTRRQRYRKTASRAPRATFCGLANRNSVADAVNSSTRQDSSGTGPGARISSAAQASVSTRKMSEPDSQ
jgi:hypothetical protein